MALLVKFIAVDNKTEIEHPEYVNKIYQSLCSAGLKLQYSRIPTRLNRSMIP